MTITEEEYELRTKLLKVQELHSTTKNQIEKEAAQEAIDILKEKLKQCMTNPEQEIESRFSINESWGQKLFFALCAKHGIKTYRYSGQRGNSIMVKATKSATEKLWLEHQRVYSSIQSHINQEIERLIKLMV